MISSITDRFSHLFRLCGLLVLATSLIETKAENQLSLRNAAPTLEVAEKLFNTGQYEEAADYAATGQDLDPRLNGWELLKSRSLLELGRYEEAFASLEAFVSKRPYELRPRLLLRQAALLTGNVEEAESQKNALGYLINQGTRRYSYDSEDIVAIGNVALLFDVDAKLVLENFFRRAQAAESPPASAFSSAGALALSKDDYKLASKAFQEGLQAHPGNVELLSGLASSYREGDRSQLLGYAERALAINPRHGSTHLLVSEHLIAAEAYDAAAAQLDQALLTNPRHPDALALKAVLAYLRNENERGDQLRAAALATWPQNPRVDYRIGKQLALKYRFSDGASHQQAALSLDEAFNPARIQLAQDLLRLGRNDEAWILADAVYESDPYNISAFNLATLRDRLDEFASIESEHFLLRLSQEEALVYGDRAVRLLEDAHARLTERYGIELPQKTTVEIYPNPADFETRTFGMPGNPGYLGVCFGPVFTINSPATRSANWEAVLYHEFCHTITLTLTNNRMPRWLSEGISVYEEQIANPAWGQRMTASYRNRILSGQMQPISAMSSAFLQAQSGEDTQFAYYQSYLVVEYIVQNYGIESLRSLLQSLGEGIAANDALATHLAPLEELDAGFVSFAKQEASQLASDYRFASPFGMPGAAMDLIAPQKSYQDVFRRASDHLAAEEWKEAIQVFEELVETAGYLPGEENAHWPLSLAYREIGDIEKEAAVLEAITRHEANRVSPINRLLELAKQQQSDPQILKWSDAALAINPMAETPWRAALTSAQALDRAPMAIEAAKALLALDAPDKPALLFQLSQLVRDSDPSAAKRHVLQALEEAPRFVDAYRLLRELQSDLARRDPQDPLLQLDLDNDFLN